MKHCLSAEDIATACGEYVAKRFYEGKTVTCRTKLHWTEVRVASGTVQVRGLNEPPSCEVEITVEKEE